jgi:periplasmic nitrate reductase NapE
MDTWLKRAYPLTQIKPFELCSPRPDLGAAHNETRRQDMDEETKPHTKAQELRAFLLLSVVMAPVLAVGVVSGYGFLVWMVQIVTGPPGTKF